MNNNIKELDNIINNSSNIVFFGGAGVSTESGIPDFRSVDGLYNLKYKYPPETILSNSFYRSKTEEFYEFYKDKMICLDAKPNYAHKYIAELEKVGKLKAVITQNIDGLHQMAGSKNVLELHGSIHRNYCQNCNTFYGLDYIIKELEIAEVPRCNNVECNKNKNKNIIKPDVVLYEEGLDGEIVSRTIESIARADVLIIAGTSLSVYPASSFINYFKRDSNTKLVVINRSKL
ncbi:MAG: NAD-dependent protein deacylase, partial [bacterium]